MSVLVADATVVFALAAADAVATAAAAVRWPAFAAIAEFLVIVGVVIIEGCAQHRHDVFANRAVCKSCQQIR